MRNRQEIAQKIADLYKLSAEERAQRSGIFWDLVNGYEARAAALIWVLSPETEPIAKEGK